MTETLGQIEQRLRDQQAPLLECLRESIEAKLRAEQAQRRGPAANDN